MKKRLVLLLICELIAFVLLFFNEAFVKSFNNIIYLLVLTLGITIMTNSLTSFIAAKFQDNQLNDIAIGIFPVLRNCQDYGLWGIYKDFPIQDGAINGDVITADILNSKSLVIVMNDAKRFISDNISLLESRLQKPNRSTTFILQDFNQSDVMDALTRKNGHDENSNYYKEKIQSVIEYHIKDLEKKHNSEHSFSCYLNSNYNTLAIILTDNYAMYSIYRIAPGKTEVPHFIFKKGCKEYDFVKKDVDNIKTLASLISIEEN